jgi:L-threonylcarbamoyladenylate synthase
MFPKQRVIAHLKLIGLRQHLKRGGVCAYPTEFCFGLGGFPSHPKAVRTTLRLKKRTVNKGLIVLAGTQQQLYRYIQPLNQHQQQVAQKYWPGANTLLLPAKSDVLSQLRGIGHKNLAVRVTAHLPAIWLTKQLGSALISTSANVAKARPIRDIRQLRKQFGHKNVWIVNAPLGKNRQPSRIIDLQQGKVLRDHFDANFSQ